MRPPTSTVATGRPTSAVTADASTTAIRAPGTRRTFAGIRCQPRMMAIVSSPTSIAAGWVRASVTRLGRPSTLSAVVSGCAAPVIG